MKTKIRTFIAVCVLSFTGLTGANASTSDASNLSLAFSTNESFLTEADMQNEAQLVSKWIADREEAKTIQRLANEGYQVATESNSEGQAFSFINGHSDLSTTDLQKEAQLVTKCAADKQEAKAIKQLEDGRLAENK